MRSKAARVSTLKSTNYPATSTAVDNTIPTTISFPHTPQFSPAGLARMLEDLQNQLPSVEDSDEANIELKGFDVKELTSYEDYCRMRDSIIEKTGNPETFDEGGRTALNVEAAAIAGAKMVIDNSRSTRALSKRLVEISGINEDDILYKGLPESGSDWDAAKIVSDTRKASLIESMVDFQKQIQFKMNVLKHIDMDTQMKKKRSDKEISKSDGPLTRRRKKGEGDKTMKKGCKRTRDKIEQGMRTPKQSHELNPLDDKRIYDEYACNIASELREEQKKRRRTAPIPFNINLLDEDEDK